MKEGININDDAALKDEADIMGAKASKADSKNSYSHPAT